MEVSTHYLFSSHLKREVQFEVYGKSKSATAGPVDLLLINDGQDLIGMKFKDLLSVMQDLKTPMVCVGIHAGPERKQEYGVSGYPDYLKRGGKAIMYSRFIMDELLPAVQVLMPDQTIHQRYFAGFSLGGLMAIDLVMDHPEHFTTAAVFSGSFWWRSKELGPGYDDQLHRIMHTKVRQKKKNALRFFFQTGQLDEKADRNNNGIIDSIDDTLDLIGELEKIGYQRGVDIEYIELPDGRHDISTWKKGMTHFFSWLNTSSK